MLANIDVKSPHCYWCSGLRKDTECIIPVNQDQELIEVVQEDPYERVLGMAREIFQCETFLEAAKFLNTKYLSEPARVQELVAPMMKKSKKLATCDKDLILGLLYLAKLKPEDDKSPLTEKACKIFKEAGELEKKTERWVGWRAIAILALISSAGGIGTGVAGRVTFSDDSTKHKDEQAATIIIVTVVATFLLAYLGLVWTGSNPVQTGSKVVVRERYSSTLGNHFRNLASTLMTLFKKEKKLAVEIANAIDFKNLHKKMESVLGSEDLDALLHINLLEQAVIYVKSDGKALPLDYSLREEIKPKKAKKENLKLEIIHE